MHGQSPWLPPERNQACRVSDRARSHSSSPAHFLENTVLPDYVLELLRQSDWAEFGDHNGGIGLVQRRPGGLWTYEQKDAAGRLRLQICGHIGTPPGGGTH